MSYQKVLRFSSFSSLFTVSKYALKDHARLLDKKLQAIDISKFENLRPITVAENIEIIMVTLGVSPRRKISQVFIKISC